MLEFLHTENCGEYAIDLLCPFQMQSSCFSILIHVYKTLFPFGVILRLPLWLPVTEYKTIEDGY